MSKPLIICVDDEIMVLNTLKTELRESLHNNFLIEVAEGAEETLEIVEEAMADRTEVPLVISDYIMPGLKGDELLARLHILIPKTLKIMLTGQADITAVGNAINNASLYRYITKPWDTKDLNLTVSEAIRSYYQDKKLDEQNRALRRMSDAFVEVLVSALDMRDTTTAGHSKRMAEYAVALAKEVNKRNTGFCKDIRFSEDQLRELHYAAMLHDIGKIGIRESVLLKEARVSADRQKAISYRFNLCKTNLEFKKNMEGIDDRERELLNNIDDYLEFLQKIYRQNHLSKEEIAKIKEIAAFEYCRIDGIKENLLDDFEVENLSIEKGNLTADEWKIIKSHAGLTYNILQKIPWTEDLALIPNIAAGHHEKMDGTGYYKGLSNKEIPIQSRILSLIDIFEALTAQDRSYKKPISKQRAIEILQEEVSLGHLDKELFEIFMQKQIFNFYGVS